MIPVKAAEMIPVKAAEMIPAKEAETTPVKAVLRAAKANRTRSGSRTVLTQAPAGAMTVKNSITRSM